MSNFQGIQGGSGDVYAGPFTWGAAGPRTLANIHDAMSPPGKYKARDDYDGAWLEVEAGEMIPLTPQVRADKDRALVASRADLRSLRHDAQLLLEAIDRMLIA